MLSIIGLLNLILGTLLLIYTVGVLFHVVPRYTTNVARWAIILLWGSSALGNVISGIYVMGGVLSGVSLANITTSVIITLGLNLLSVIGVTILLILIITDHYYKKNGS